MELLFQKNQRKQINKGVDNNRAQINNAPAPASWHAQNFKPTANDTDI